MTDTTQDIKDAMQKYCDEILKTRSAHLEMFSAAFFNEVGSKAASEWELVEDRTEIYKIKWYWRKRDPLK